MTKIFVLEGPDGAGKTTTIAKLKQGLAKAGYGCEVKAFPSDKAYVASLHKDAMPLAFCKDMLHFAKAWLARHYEAYRGVLLIDRFIDSTEAYQVIAEGMPVQHLVDTTKLMLANMGFEYETLVLTCPQVECNARMEKRGNMSEHESDAYFMSRVHYAYAKIAERDRLATFDTTSPNYIAELVKHILHSAG